MDERSHHKMVEDLQVLLLRLCESKEDFRANQIREMANLDIDVDEGWVF